MEYFTLTSQKGNPIPQIKNWFGNGDRYMLSGYFDRAVLFGVKGGYGGDQNVRGGHALFVFCVV